VSSLNPSLVVFRGKEKKNAPKPQSRFCPTGGRDGLFCFKKADLDGKGAGRGTLCIPEKRCKASRIGGLCDVSRSTSEGGLTRRREAYRVSALRNPPDEESTNERGASGSETADSKRGGRG
jgi:hypothetical protein